MFVMGFILCHQSRCKNLKSMRITLDAKNQRPDQNMFLYAGGKLSNSLLPPLRSSPGYMTRRCSNLPPGSMTVSHASLKASVGNPRDGRTSPFISSKVSTITSPHLKEHHSIRGKENKRFYSLDTCFRLLCGIFLDSSCDSMK